MTPRKTDAAVLAELEVMGGQVRDLGEQLHTALSHRDFLIVAACQRGLSFRTIARAAGVHYTRVAQLCASADEVTAKARLRPRKGKRPPPPRLDP